MKNITYRCIYKFYMILCSIITVRRSVTKLLPKVLPKNRTEAKVPLKSLPEALLLPPRSLEVMVLSSVHNPMEYFPIRRIAPSSSAVRGTRCT